MREEDTGIVLKYRPHSEKYFIVDVFGGDIGHVGGLIQRGKFAPPQPGDIVDFTLTARLETHLGRLRLEIRKSNSALRFLDSARAYLVSATLELLRETLPPRHPYPRLWRETALALEKFYAPETALKSYCRFELLLLKELGFGLSLKVCALTGVKENLTHVSPKTGRAACAAASKPYADKLLKLPAFLIDENAEAETGDILNALRLTGHFLKNCLTRERPLPIARHELVKTLAEKLADNPD